MKENVIAGLSGGLAFMMVVFIMFCGIITSSDVGPLTWESNTKAVLILEGVKASTMDCLNQYGLVSIGGDVVYKGGEWVTNKNIKAVWDNQDSPVALGRIPDGTKVAIYEKKFWWMHRYFIVCE